MEYDLIDVYEMLTRLNAEGFKTVIRYAEALTHADEYRAKAPVDSYLESCELIQELATEGRVVSFAHYRDCGHTFYAHVKANAAHNPNAEKLLQWAQSENPAKKDSMLTKRVNAKAGKAARR